MALTKVTSNVIADSAITAEKISNTVTLGGPKIANVQYADASFTVLDDTAANTAGTARLVINGEGFNSGVTVIVGTTVADSITRVSSTQLRANVTPQAASSYPIYVQNTDGGTAIRINGVTFSNTPVWGTAATLSNQAANTSFNVSISATSDSNVTYSNTTALPAGTSLLSNGYFYGTVTIGAETVYTFDVKANDAENQDNTRTFSLTVTVGPPAGSIYFSGLVSNYGSGINDRINRSSPVQIGSDTSWIEVSTGAQSFFGIKSNGTLWGWGRNLAGELGLNDVVHRSSPVQVGSSTNWSKIGTESGKTLAIKTDGTLWVWGNKNMGQLGLNNTIDNRSSPVQLGTGTDWRLISLGRYTTGAIKTDNTLWVWGRGNNGEIGDNATTDRSSPVQVGTNWSLVSIGYQQSLGIKNDGTLWAWGSRTEGTLGLSESPLLPGVSSPTQVGSGTTWLKVSCGYFATLATKTDGTLWSFGKNSQGQLGHNDKNGRSSPVQVGSSTNWDLVSATGQYQCSAIKTDKTIWTWGTDSFGALGLNTTSYAGMRSSPTQLGTDSTWVALDMGQAALLAIKQ